MITGGLAPCTPMDISSREIYEILSRFLGFSKLVLYRKFKIVFAWIRSPRLVRLN